MKKRMKRVFLTGLAVVIPAGLTIYVLFFIIDVMDNLLRVIPDNYQPEHLFGVHIPGLGVIVTVILLASFVVWSLNKGSNTRSENTTAPSTHLTLRP